MNEDDGAPPPTAAGERESSSQDPLPRGAPDRLHPERSQPKPAGGRQGTGAHSRGAKGKHLTAWLGAGAHGRRSRWLTHAQFV